MIVDEIVLADASETHQARLYEIFADVVALGDGYPEQAPLQADRFAASWVSVPIKLPTAPSIQSSTGIKNLIL